MNERMNDLELLELSAKSLGGNFHSGVFFTVDGIDGDHIEWNPLTDDGDALRLAVKLHITVSNSETQKHACASSLVIPGVFINHHKDDAYAATRRAIVSVAAEIGKTKP